MNRATAEKPVAQLSRASYNPCNDFALENDNLKFYPAGLKACFFVSKLNPALLETVPLDFLRWVLGAFS